MKILRLTIALIWLLPSMVVTQWITNGSNIVWTNDNVGINTNIPTAKLHLYTGANANGMIIEGSDNADAWLQIKNGGGSHYLFDDDSNAHALTFESANDMVFNTSGPYARMRIYEIGDVAIDGNTFYLDASTNRIGIGRPVPDQALDILGNIQLYGSNKFIRFRDSGINVGFLGFNSNTMLLTNSIANGELSISSDGEINFFTSGVEKMVVRKNGNIEMDVTDNTFFLDNPLNRIGIRTSDPQATLDVNGDIMLSDANGKIEFGDGTDVYSTIQSNTTNMTLTHTGGPATSTGHVYFENGVGDFNIAARDFFRISTNDSISLVIDDEGGTQIARRMIEAYPSNNNIYMTSDYLTYTGQFHVDGDVEITGEMFAASDARIKHGIVQINTALDKLSKLNPVAYHFRTEEFSDLHLAEGQHMGLLAQEVQEVFPELVKTTNK